MGFLEIQTSEKIVLLPQEYQTSTKDPTRRLPSSEFYYQTRFPISENSTEMVRLKITPAESPNHVRIQLRISSGSQDAIAPMDFSIRTEEQVQILKVGEDGYGEVVLEKTLMKFLKVNSVNDGTEFLNLEFLESTDLIRCVLSHTEDRTELKIEGVKEPISIPRISTLDDLTQFLEKLPDMEIQHDRGRFQFRKIKKLLKKLGMELVLAGGRHPVKVKHPDTGQLIPIPFHGNGADLSPGTVKSIFKQLGLDPAILR